MRFRYVDEADRVDDAIREELLAALRRLDDEDRARALRAVEAARQLLIAAVQNPPAPARLERIE